ncbi:MAG: SRPBCC family protein [Alphaproteobacteria bacterium]|nr:SRPBCC family protein [Alphaproteobacteria bacterium]
MKKLVLQKPDPQLDLVLDRVVEVPRELVWKAWTQPEHLKAWYTPRPWRTIHCEIDLQPGGIFRTVMQAPEGGATVDNVGCYLEVVLGERLVWTDTLLPGWRPADGTRFGMTVVLELQSIGESTRYVATALHKDENGRQRHEQMGFHNGWATALDQLIEHIKATTAT